MKAPPLDWLVATCVIAVIGSTPTTSGSPPRSSTPAAESTVRKVAQQSPIDIRGDDLRVVKTRDVGGLTIHYGTKATVDVENTGSPGEEATVRANVATGDGELRVNDKVYRLVQFHWHAPAEHEVDGVRYPMEMHLVHSAADGSTLVIGVFLRAGAANAALTPIFSRLPTHAKEHTSVTGVNVAALIPHNGEESARYTGSLTTPPFTEGVRWIVLAPPIDVSREQIAAFSALFPEGNSRHVQPLNGRTVSTDDANFEQDEGVTKKGKRE